MNKKNSFLSCRNSVKPSRQEVIKSLNESLEANDLAIYRLNVLIYYFEEHAIKDNENFINIPITRSDYESLKYCDFVCKNLKKFYKDGLKRNGVS